MQRQTVGKSASVFASEFEADLPTVEPQAIVEAEAEAEAEAPVTGTGLQCQDRGNCEDGDVVAHELDSCVHADHAVE